MKNITELQPGDIVYYLRTYKKVTKINEAYIVKVEIPSVVKKRKKQLLNDPNITDNCIIKFYVKFKDNSVECIRCYYEDDYDSYDSFSSQDIYFFTNIKSLKKYHICLSEIDRSQTMNNIEHYNAIGDIVTRNKYVNMLNSIQNLINEINNLDE